MWVIPASVWLWGYDAGHSELYRQWSEIGIGAMRRWGAKMRIVAFSEATPKLRDFGTVEADALPCLESQSWFAVFPQLPLQRNVSS